MPLRDVVFNAVLYATTAFYSTMAAIVLGVKYLKYGNAMIVPKPHLRPPVLDKWKHNFVKLTVFFFKAYSPFLKQSFKDIKMHYVEAGDPKNPLMLCVHGFPEFWYSYRYQLDYFKNKYQ